MCLAVPGKILAISNKDPLFRQGQVSFSGIVKNVSLAFVPDAKIGDYVLVHAGFAINRLDERQARISLQAIEGLANLQKDTPP